MALATFCSFTLLFLNHETAGNFKESILDVKFEDVDFEKHSLFVMEKIFNFGSWNDQLEIMRYYGLPRIEAEIIKANYLRKPVLSFLSVLL